MKFKSLIVIAALVLFVSVANAQERRTKLGIEITAGPSFSLGDIGGVDVKTGKGIEGIISFMPVKYFGLFAGWGWNQFNHDYVKFFDKGLMFGLQYKSVIGKTSLSYYFRAGGVYNDIIIKETVSGLSNEFFSDSGYGLGIHLSGGIEYSLGRDWHLNSNLKFQHLKNEAFRMEGPLIVAEEPTFKTSNLNYISLRVGIVKYF